MTREDQPGDPVDSERDLIPRCVDCGSPSAQAWDTREGRIQMCRPCATMNGIGCN